VWSSRNWQFFQILVSFPYIFYYYFLNVVGGIETRQKIQVRACSLTIQVLGIMNITSFFINILYRIFLNIFEKKSEQNCSEK